jgi:hypothetical protein
MADFASSGVGPLVSQRVTIGSLPDNVLLDTFDFCQVISDESPWDWEALVHVCQRWRYVVFESPIRLNLELLCTEKTPVKKLLRVWPASLPIVIHLYCDYAWSEWNDPVDGFNNIVAALKRNARVRQIDIANTADVRWERILTAIKRRYPVLRSLSFDSLGEAFTLPNKFLNRSARCLQDLTLRAISFPSLPRLLLSTGDLTSLRLFEIPTSGYISPVTMATSLSALPKLTSLSINFKSPTLHPELPRPPPTRFILPALTELNFLGAGEYFEVLAAQIDAPLLDHFDITFFYQLVFDIPQTIRFCDHLKLIRPSSLALMFSPPHYASIHFSSNTVPHSMSHPSLEVDVTWLDRQVSSVAHICSQILPFRSSVESLNIQCPGFSYSDLSAWVTRDETNSTVWLQLFHSFTSVHSLDISAPLEPFIAAALQGLAEQSAAKVLPSLRSLSIVGKMSVKAVQKGIESFVAARQHSSHPVAISCRKGN